MRGVYLELERLRERRLPRITVRLSVLMTIFRMQVCNCMITTVFANSLAFHAVTDS